MILGVRPAGRGPWVGLSGVTAASGGATLWRCPAQLLAAAGTERAVAMARLRPRRRAHRRVEPAALQGWGSQLCPRTRCPHTCCVATAGGRAAERSVTTLGSRRPHPPEVTCSSLSRGPRCPRPHVPGSPVTGPGPCSHGAPCRGHPQGLTSVSTRPPLPPGRPASCPEPWWPPRAPSPARHGARRGTTQLPGPWGASRSPLPGSVAPWPRGLGARG